MHAAAQGRQTGDGEFQLVQHGADLRGFRVEHPIAPALVMALGAGVHLIRVDQRQAAGRRQVIDAAIAIALRAGFDHGDGVAVMHMGREAMLDVTRGQQLQAAQMTRLPEMRVLPRLAHGYALNSASRRCFTSGQSRSVML
ncbi:hypothetical protein D3C72_1489130 [compost metagenome]